MVWALKRTVSICNNRGPFGLVTVTDQDGRLAADEKSQSVTSRGRKPVYLLQIKTFDDGAGECLDL